MPFKILSSANKGRLYTALGVIILSPDALLLRLITTDIWTIIWWRGLLTTITITIFLIIYYRRNLIKHLISSLVSIEVISALLWGLGTIFFVLAIKNASVANVLVILSSGPLFGSFLSYFILKEHISKKTWAASATVFLGLALVFSESISQGMLFGNLYALITTICATTAFVILRKSPKSNPIILAAISSAFVTIISFPISSPLSIDLVDFQYLFLLSVVLLPASYILIFTGPKFITAPEVGMIMLLETILGPLWIWLVIGEEPTKTVVIAGIIIVATLLIHSIASIREN